MSTMDSWFSGYTRNYSLAVWTGYDHQFKANSYVTSAQTTIAQQIYKNVMSYISQDKPNQDWVQPSDVVSTERGGQTEYYVAGYPGTVTDNSSNQTTSGYTTDSSSSSAVVTQPRGSESSSESSASTPSEQKPSGDGGNNGSDDNSSSASSTDNSGNDNNNATDNGGNTTNGGNDNNGGTTDETQ